MGREEVELGETAKEPRGEKEGKTKGGEEEGLLVIHSSEYFRNANWAENRVKHGEYSVRVDGAPARGHSGVSAGTEGAGAHPLGFLGCCSEMTSERKVDA